MGGKLGVNASGIRKSPEYYNAVSRALNKVLRHSWELPVDTRGFSFAEDLVYVLGDLHRYHLSWQPSVADVLYVLVRLDAGRFQGSSLLGTG